MSVPSSQLRQEMGAMISDLLQQCGLQLLEQPLRLEGWLRDIYPEHRAPVSVAIEALQTQCHLESGAIQDVSARLALRSGLAPQWADFGVRLWRVALKGHKLDVQVVQSIHSNADSTISGGVTQTVDAILGPFRD
jgi:hypothetical protein